MADDTTAAAPLGEVTSGHLAFARGFSNITIRVDPTMPDLYRAHFTGRPWGVQVEGGAVTLTDPPGFHLVDFDPAHWHATTTEITLNGSIPWQIAIRSVAHLMADLRGLDLRALEVAGGVSRMDVTLPPPHGAVAVRFTESLSNVTLHRPAGVAARVQVSGAASGLALDSQQVGATHGPAGVESPGYQGATDRYDIAVLASASDLTIDTY